MKTTIKFTAKNGKNYTIKNLPQGPEGKFSKVLGAKVRYNPTKNMNYPEVFVNGEWVTLHRYVLAINGVNVPAGFNRHHMNQNVLDNTLQNIVVVDKEEHMKLHNEFDVENGEATEYKNIYQIPSGGYKYIDLKATPKDMIAYSQMFAWELPKLLRKLDQARVYVQKI